MRKILMALLVVGMALSGVEASSVGEAVGGKVSTFIVGDYMSASKVSSKLKSNGFQVLTSYRVGGATSVVFTSAELKKMGSKKNKGFISALRVLVDKKHNQIAITNPLYFSKAYMQSNYKASEAKKVLDRLNKAFTSLKNSKDSLKSSKLSGFQFMMGMPYYEDMDTIAEGTNKSLLAKVKASGKILFRVNLSNGSTLVGVKLGKSTSKFPNKIGTSNASVLPYTVLIEGGKARTLAPKYNIALYYPLLTMSQFMTISSVPASIVSDLKSAF